MNPGRGSKRNICRYFSSSGSCFYGDSCQFQHVLEHPGPGGILRAATTSPVPPLRSQSAGNTSMHSGPPLSMGLGNPPLRLNLPPSTEGLKRSEHPSFQARVVSQRTASYRTHHASNPPKHRMGGGRMVGGAANHTHPHPSTKLQSPPQKKDQGTGGVGRGGAGNHSDDVIAPLQPPPVSKQAKPRPIPSTSTSASSSQQPHIQSGGTTYFYSGQQPSYAPDYTVYTKPPSHLSRNSSSSSPSSSSTTPSDPPQFFLSNDLQQEIQQKQLACLAVTSSEETCPKEVDNYHSLCPLESVSSDQDSKRLLFGHSSTCYRATNRKDGLYYCLRRIHGCRLTSAKAVQELDKWKKMDHVNLVSLREMFTTKIFGDNSVVLVYDYHPAARTLVEKHLRHSKRTSPLPEELVWEYVIQLASALRLVHSHHLALRCLDPSKVLVVNHQGRLRVNCGGSIDILTFDSASSSHVPLSMHQQGDLFSLGQLLLSVVLQSSEAGHPDHLHRSMDLIASSYSPDLTHLLQYLLQSGSKGHPHSILEVMPMLGSRLHLSIERALHREDVLEMELSKEMQNGRLFRILAKLGTINERPEFSGDEQWSETGDRYLLKLLRDYLFHQVLPSGRPWVNLAHIVQTLNKIDAGSYENLALHSRDEQSVLVVSYADLKACLGKTFSEILASGGGGRGGGRGGGGGGEGEGEGDGGKTANVKSGSNGSSLNGHSRPHQPHRRL